MCKQPAISGLRHAMKKIPRRKQFLAEMDAVVPWGRLQSPHHPKLGPNGGRPPMPLETMPRIHFRQNWSAPSDPMTAQTFYDNEAIRRCAGNGPGDDRIPPLRDSATQGPAEHDLPLTDILRAATGGREGGKGGRPKHWVARSILGIGAEARIDRIFPRCDFSTFHHRQRPVNIFSWIALHLRHRFGQTRPMRKWLLRDIKYPDPGLYRVIG